MNESDRIQTYQARCPHLRPALIRDFVLQMDPEYFESFPSTDIIQHLELANQLTFDQPCAVLIHAISSQQYQLTLVAYDYFSEFATFCGVLSSFGLDIREAMIFPSLETASPIPTSGKPSRGRLPIWKKPAGTFIMTSVVSALRISVNDHTGAVSVAMTVPVSSTRGTRTVASISVIGAGAGGVFFVKRRTMRSPPKKGAVAGP